jgi:hypothetical protein
MKHEFITKQYDAQPFIDGQGGEGKAAEMIISKLEAHIADIKNEKTYGRYSEGVIRGLTLAIAYLTNDVIASAPQLLSQLTAAKEENERLKAKSEPIVNDDLDLQSYEAWRIHKEANGRNTFRTGYYLASVKYFTLLTAAKAEADALRRENSELKKKWEDNPLTDAVYEGADQWEQEYKDCRDILQHLVELKNSKDAFGKTEKYEELQPLAWKRAKDFLKDYQHQ